MASGFHCILLLCLTSGLWWEANAKRVARKGDCCDTCPPGWTQFGSRCFMFNSAEKDWSDAEISCIALGGNLASIQTDDDYTFIREMVRRAAGKDKTAWIGGYDAVKEGVWKWSDGSMFGFKKWAAGEPNNHSRREHCMEMNFKERDYVNDMRCPEKRSFVCAREPSHIE